MSVKKVSGTILILLGIGFFIAGMCQYNKAQTPNTCIVSFTKSLGGKASMEFKDSIRRTKYYGIAGISVGVVFTLAGGVLLFKSRRKRY